MSSIKKVGIASLSLAIIFGLAFNTYLKIEWGKSEVHAELAGLTATPSYEFNFSSTQTLKEASTKEGSASSDWWLRSGGTFRIANGAGRTLEGELSDNDPYRLAYASKAPIASDNGYHPQNIFRLLTQKSWKDAEQQVYLKVLGDNLFNPENSHAWNAASLIERYQDEDNYYYVGIRMDGNAVIKKKRSGTYSTLAIKPVFSGSYDRYLNPNIIPKNAKFGIKSKIYNASNGSVVIEVYVDKEGSGNWILAASATDSSNAISREGRGGMYTDYMDIEFSSYKVWTLGQQVAPAPVEDTVSKPIPTVPTSPATTTATTTTTTRPVATTTETTKPVVTTPTTTTPTVPEDDEPTNVPLSGYGLSSAGSIQETGSMGESSSQYWWVNSGAYFNIGGGIGKTVQGRLSDSDRWKSLYSSANPTDTENGYQPQNIFRLVSKSTFKNYAEQAYFKMNKYNVSSSPNRDGHNGLLFFNRYKDGNNLYYTGVRVDGKAVIKKKVGGSYYTLALKPVYSGSYNRSSNPNLIPTGKWIGLRSEVKDLADGSVSIKLYIDKDGNGNWTLAAEANDNGSQGAKVSGKYSVGIRTDFADVEVKDYSVKEL